MRREFIFGTREISCRPCGVSTQRVRKKRKKIIESWKGNKGNILSTIFDGFPFIKEKSMVEYLGMY